MTQLQIYNAALNKLGEPPVLAVDASTPSAQACNAAYQLCLDRLIRKHRWNFSRGDEVVAAAFSDMDSIADDGNGVVEVTTASAHNLTTGDRVLVDGTGVDGHYYVTVTGSTTFTLDESDSSNALEAGTYHLAPKHSWGYKLAWPTDAIALRTVDGYEADKPARSFTVAGRYIYVDAEEVDVTFSKRMVAGTDEGTFDPIFTDLLASLLAVEVAVTVTGAMSRRDDMFKLYQVELTDALMSNAFERRDRGPTREGVKSIKRTRLYGEE